MLGTSARIGEVLAIRKRDVDVTVSPATVLLAGTIISRPGVATYRQDRPKTASSWCRVSVPSFAAEALRQRLVTVADQDPEHLIFYSRNHITGKPQAADGRGGALLRFPGSRAWTTCHPDRGPLCGALRW